MPALAFPPVVVSPESISLAVEETMKLCRRFEGLRLRPYLCPAGVPTIGYGSTVYADGRRVQLTDPLITIDQAERLLWLTVTQEFMPAVMQICPRVDTPGRLAALVDFSYNLGTGRLRASTLRKRVNAGDWQAVPAELRKWIYARGRILSGLLLRREAESLLIQP